MKTSDSIGALWRKEKTKDGKTTEFLPGKIKDVPAFVFENNKKTGDNDVDYKIMQSEAIEDSENETELVCTGGLYEKKKKDSEIYLVGNFRGEDIVVFKNSFKKEDKHPEFHIFLDLPRDIEKK